MTVAVAPARLRFDVEACRREFSILTRTVRGGKPLVYLDSAATTQRPRPVLDAVRHHAEWSNANVHRGVHLLAEEATDAYEKARARVARAVGGEPDEVVFTRGTTESLNLAAAVLGAGLREGDEVVLSRLEHHSNIVPWQLVAARTRATIRVAELDPAGDLDLEAFAGLLGPRTRIVSLAHVSNTLGTVLPIAQIAELAHRVGALLVVDGAQAIAHRSVDVCRLGCDAYAFSGHKTYGPMGIGALWMRRELLEAAQPWQGGGSMIRRVSFEGSTWADPPQRFEAGTPNVEGAVGLAAAFDWLAAQDQGSLERHEADLLDLATAGLGALPGVRVLGQPRERGPVLSFVVDALHPHDLATLLDGEGIAIRAGHHCTQPLLASLGLAATARASFACHTTQGEIEQLVAAVARARERFAP